MLKMRRRRGYDQSNQWRKQHKQQKVHNVGPQSSYGVFEIVQVPRRFHPLMAANPPIYQQTLQTNHPLTIKETHLPINHPNHHLRIAIKNKVIVVNSAIVIVSVDDWR